jgi:virginiamycin B lyase
LPASSDWRNFPRTASELPMSLARALLVAGALAPASLPLFPLVAQNAPAHSAPQSASPFAPREFEVPYGARTRPRDPFADAQGRVWFVGQNGNYIARLDPKSGEFTRYEIEPGTNPHNRGSSPRT